MKILLILVLLLCSYAVSSSQQSHKGKDFYFSCTGRVATPVYASISADVPTKGKFEVKYGKEFTDTIPFSITDPSKPLCMYIPGSEYCLVESAYIHDHTESRDNGQVVHRNLRIIAENDVSVQTLCTILYGSESCLLYPVSSYGTEYLVYAPASKVMIKDGPNSFPTKSYSQAIIIATEKFTVVNVKSPVGLIGSTEKEFTVYLNQGDTYLLQALPIGDDSTADLTGMSITSNAPIAVFSGAERFNLGEIPNIAYSRNNVFEQILPVKKNYYGKTIIVTDPIKSVTDKKVVSNLCKVMAMEDTSSLYVNDNFIKKLKKGESATIPISDYSVINGSSPIAAILLRYSAIRESEFTSDSYPMGNPFMVDIPSIEFWTDKYDFSIWYNGDFPYLPQFDYNYVNIIVPEKAKNNLMINGVKVNTSSFTELPSFTKSDICDKLLFGTVSLKLDGYSITCSEPFSVVVYGYSRGDAHGYVPGRSLISRQLPALYVKNNDTIICPEASVELSANGGDGTYSWSPKEGLSCSDCPNPVATPTKNTTYTVTSNNAFGCAVLKDTVHIIIQPALVDAGKDVGICSGDSIRLSVTEGKSYLWSPSEGLNCTDCREPFAKPTKNQRYYVTITDMKGCTGTDSVLVSVGKPTADAGKDTTICLGSSVQVRASGGNYYRWADSPDLSCTDCPDPVITPKESTTYTVTSYLSANCFAMDSIRITVDKPTITITSDKTILCPTDSVILKAEGGIQTQWIGEGIVCDNCSETKASPPKSGFYRATITTATGCTISDSVFITLNNPTAKVSPDTTICKGNTALLRAEGGIRYSWSPPTGLSCTDCARPAAIPQQTTIYTVTTYDNNNCTAQASVLVTVDSCPIIIKADTITLTASMNCAQIEDEQRYKHSSDKPLQLQVPELISGDGSDFVVTYNMPTNSTLNNNEELIITTELLSTSPTPKQAVYRLGISQERELHLKASGEYITKTANLRPLDTLGVIPGEGYVPIRLQADGDIEQIRELRTILSFPSRFMNYVPNKHRIISSAGWNFGIEKNEEKNGITYITLKGTGTATLTDKKEIVMIETDIYLGDSVEFTVMTEQSEVPNECYTIPQGKGIVSLGGCFAGGRAINTGIPYSVQTKTENNTLVIDYTSGLDGITECTILNTFGEHIADILYRTDTRGEYRINYPLESLSSGNYIVLFRSGIFNQTQLLNIVK